MRNPFFNVAKPKATMVNSYHKLKLPLICTSLLALTAVILTAQPANSAAKDNAMPNCALTSLEGKQTEDLHQHHGKVLYVDFWASWCGPCAQSFPFLNDLNREFSAKGLHVIGVNVDESAEDAQSFLAKHPASFNIAADASGQCPKNFGVKAMPSTYLIDRNGVVRYTHLGFRTGETKKLREMVEKLLAE